MMHWPLYSPHRVENLDCVNISMTTEYWTEDIRRRQMVNLANGIGPARRRRSDEIFRRARRTALRHGYRRLSVQTRVRRRRRAALRFDRRPRPLSLAGRAVSSPERPAAPEQAGARRLPAFQAEFAALNEGREADFRAKGRSDIRRARLSRPSGVSATFLLQPVPRSPSCPKAIQLRALKHASRKAFATSRLQSLAVSMKCSPRSAAFMNATASKRSRRRRSSTRMHSANFWPMRTGLNAGVFSFQDDDEQWMSLRYDLTARLARYVAQNYQTLPEAVPPLTCSAMSIAMKSRGRGASASSCSSTPTPWVPIASPPTPRCACWWWSMLEALGVKRGDYVIKVNNRKVLDGVMKSIELGWGKGECSKALKRASGDRQTRQVCVGKGRGSASARPKRRKDESGDFTKGAGLTENQVEYVLPMECNVR